MLPVTSAAGMKQSTTRIPRSMVLMVGPRPCPHPLQALQVSQGPAPPAVPSPWGQAAPLLAHTASLLLPPRHMIHSQVKPLQWKCSNRKFTCLVALALGSLPCASATPSSACQQCSPPSAMQLLCCRMCASAWGFAGLPLSGREVDPPEVQFSFFTESTYRRTPFPSPR